MELFFHLFFGKHMFQKCCFHCLYLQYIYTYQSYIYSLSQWNSFFHLFFYLYKTQHSDELYAVRVTDKIGFLYNRFVKGAEFWELHELVRKVLLTGFATALASSPSLQVMMASLVW